MKTPEEILILQIKRSGAKMPPRIKKHDTTIQDMNKSVYIGVVRDQIHLPDLRSKVKLHP